MAMGSIITLTDIYMKVSGKTINAMGMGYITLKVGKNKKLNG